MIYLTISTNVRRYQTHHRWQFFSFRKTSHRCIVRVRQSNWVKMWFSCFPVSPGSAEGQVIWGGILKRLLIPYFIGNIFAKKYQNPLMCVIVIASQRWDAFFETWCTVYQPRRWPKIVQFCWPPVSDVGVVTKPRSENNWNLLGCPKLPNRSQPLVGQSSPYCGDRCRRYCCLTSFFSDCRYMP